MAQPAWPCVRKGNKVVTWAGQGRALNTSLCGESCLRGPDRWETGSGNVVLVDLMLDVWVGARLRSSLRAVEMPVVTGQSCKVNIWLSVDLETGAVCLV